MRIQLTKILISMLCVAALSPFLASHSAAQSIEISPRNMERMTRNMSKMLGAVVPRNCNADSVWFSGGVFATGTVRSDMKVIKPNGTVYVCKECNTCSGITCQSASGKPIYVANYCSGADGEVNF